MRFTTCITTTIVDVVEVSIMYDDEIVINVGCSASTRKAHYIRNGLYLDLYALCQTTMPF